MCEAVVVNQFVFEAAKEAFDTRLRQRAKLLEIVAAVDDTRI